MPPPKLGRLPLSSLVVGKQSVEAVTRGFLTDHFDMKPDFLQVRHADNGSPVEEEWRLEHVIVDLLVVQALEEVQAKQNEDFG